jgi:uncharacterized membrane protein
MDTISGIPAHPLFVHIPAVLLPLAALLAIFMLIKQSWFERYKWALLGVTGIGALGAILASSAGESLQESIERKEGAQQAIRDHAQEGETARMFGIVFFIIVALWILVPIILERRAARSGSNSESTGVSKGSPAQPKWLRPVVAALVVLSAGAATISVISAGHSGAKSVWSEEGGD